MQIESDLGLEAKYKQYRAPDPGPTTAPAESQSSKQQPKTFDPTPTTTVSPVQESKPDVQPDAVQEASRKEKEPVVQGMQLLNCPFCAPEISKQGRCSSAQLLRDKLTTTA